jgi:DUF4097 and DUF4098 domain-containing protein YvlB
MRQAVCGILIVLFLVVMAALRWGPGLMSVAPFGGYRFDRQGETATLHLDGDIFADVKNVVVDNRHGKVRIEVADGTPGWSWDLTCWADTLELAEHLAQQTQMRVDQQPTRSSWTLVLPSPSNRQLRGVESKLTLKVPASAKVDVRNQHADTEILGVQGATRARCRHGKLQLSDLAGNIDAETSYAALSAERIAGAKLVNRHGSITATDVDGDLEATSAHGEVAINRVAGRLKVNNQYGKVVAGKIAGPAEIQTSYADIHLEDVGGSAMLRNRHGRISGRRLRGNVDARNEYNTIDLDANCAEVVCKNQHGEIKLRLADPKLRLVRAETSYADLELNVCDPLAPKIEAQTSNGSLKSDIPIYAMGTGTNNFQGLGASAARITLKNQYGNIRIRRSPKSDSGQ